MRPDLSDRGVQAAIVLVAMAALGFAAIGLGWSGAAAQIYASVQLPFIASGVLGGVALAGTSLALLAVHLDRRSAAVDRHRIDAAIRLAGAVADTLPQALHHEHAARRLALVVNGRTVHRPDCRVAVGRRLPPLSQTYTSPTRLRSCRLCRPQL